MVTPGAHGPLDDVERLQNDAGGLLEQSELLFASDRDHAALPLPVTVREPERLVDPIRDFRDVSHTVHVREKPRSR